MTISVEAIRKALKEQGLDEEKIDKALEGQTDEGEGGDEGEPDVAGDFMKGLFSGVSAVMKSKDGDKDAALQEVFQKAYEQLGGVFNEVAEFGYASGHEDGLKKAKKPAADPEDAADGGDDEAEEDMAKFLKSVNPKVGAYVATLEKGFSKLAKRVNDLETERETNLFKSKAKSIGETDATADLLLKVAKGSGKETADALANLLKGKNEQLRKGALFSEHGGDNPESGASAADQLSAKAAELVKASNGKITFAKAFTQICETNPDLYRQHVKEQRGGR